MVVVYSLNKYDLFTNNKNLSLFLTGEGISKKQSCFQNSLFHVLMVTFVSLLLKYIQFRIRKNKDIAYAESSGANSESKKKSTRGRLVFTRK